MVTASINTMIALEQQPRIPKAGTPERVPRNAHAYPENSRILSPFSGSSRCLWSRMHILCANITGMYFPQNSEGEGLG